MKWEYVYCFLWEVTLERISGSGRYSKRQGFALLLFFTPAIIVHTFIVGIGKGKPHRSFYMTNAQLKAIMRFQLSNFNDESVQIDDDTIHNTVLSESEGIGSVNSKQIYCDVIKFTLLKQGHSVKIWPDHWMNLSVAELAGKLI
jgi:hypothetical protein